MIIFWRKGQLWPKNVTNKIFQRFYYSISILVNYTIREWLPYNDYEAPEAVEATELPGPIPTLQRLWFGQAPEDKQKRLQAFLSCLFCDGFNHAAIPPHLGMNSALSAVLCGFLKIFW